MLTHITSIEFPAFAGVNINMMPIVVGDHGTLGPAHQYASVIGATDLQPGAVAYLSVTESVVTSGTQRRGGIHTEATSGGAWGGSWGRGGPGLGVYMGSTDGACRAWDCEVFTGSAHGTVAEPDMPAIRLQPNALYRMTDRTPHEALPSRGRRQWVRIVADAIYGWWAQHSTPSPVGVQPNAVILTGSKFSNA